MAPSKKRPQTGEPGGPIKKKKKASPIEEMEGRPEKHNKAAPTGETSKSAKEKLITVPYILFLGDYNAQKKEAIPQREGKPIRFKISEHTREAAAVWKTMTTEERQPFVTRANENKEAKARLSDNVGKAKKMTGPPVFRTRCTPRKLVEVNKGLTEVQKDVVKEIGFGGMIGLKCTVLPRDFINRLVHCFNPATKSLEFGRARVYEITVDDVHRALGLSLGTIPVPKTTQNASIEYIRTVFCGNEDEEEMLEKVQKLKRKSLRDTFDKRGGPTFAMLEEVINEGGVDNKFKTAYVLFVLACFLCPTTKDVASYRFYPALQDVSKIASYQWPQFILDWLVNQIRTFKTRGAKKDDNKTDAPGLGGCLLILMLIYFDKQPLGMNVGNVTLPLIEAWTTKLIGERIAKEENLDIVEPIEDQFPRLGLRHPLAIAAYHDFKKNFLKMLPHLVTMDEKLMEGVDGGIISSDNVIGGFEDQEDGMQHGTVPGGNLSGVEQQQQQQQEVDEQEEEDDEEQTPPPSVAPAGIQRPNRALKKGKSVKTPYVGQPQLKGAKYSKEERAVFTYVMKAIEAKELEVLVKMDCMKYSLSRKDIHEVFKPRGHMSTLVMASMTEWLMEIEKDSAPIRHGVHSPRRHMFSCVFVANLKNFSGVKSQDVLNDPVHAQKLGYDVADCDVLLLPVLDKGHWFCVAISLADKRIDVLDPMRGEGTIKDRKRVTQTVVSMLYKVVRRTRPKLDDSWNKWEIHFPEVPQQANIHDCGFYTIHFMENWLGRWKSRKIEGKMAGYLRNGLLLRILFSPRNNVLDEVKAAAAEDLKSTL